MSPTRSGAPVTAQIRLPDQSAVRLEGVSTHRGSALALDDLDLTIPRNICFGISGHPGSGVDEVTELIAGRLRPSAGSVHVLGFESSQEPMEINRRLGYLPHPHALPPHLLVDEYLRLLASAYGVRRDAQGALVDTLLTLVGLAGRQGAVTNQLSPASQQLVAVAGALVHDPTVVVLHEPTDGLDTRARTRLWNMLHRLTDMSRTIVVCSRHFSELAVGCAEVAVLDGGRLVDQGAPAEVTGRLGGARRVRARLANGAVRTHTVADDAAQAALLKKLVLADVDLVEFAEVAPELDDLALRGSAPSTERPPAASDDDAEPAP